MSRTHLLLAAPTFYPSYGGAEIRFRRYLPKLKEFGVDAAVFTGTPKSKKISEADKTSAWYQAKEGDCLPPEFYEGIQITRYRLPERPAKKRLEVFHQKLQEYILSNKDQIDVIQFLSPFPMLAIKTLHLARRHNIKTVFSFTLAKKKNKNLFKEWQQKQSMKKLFDAVDHVVVSSDEVANYLQQRGIKSNLSIISNGVDTDLFRPAHDQQEITALRDKLKISPIKKVLLNVGSVHPRKGTDLLLRAFQIVAKENSDIELFIVGPRSDETDESLIEFNKEINQLLAEPLIKNRVHFCGMVDNVHEYMRVADVFVFPSREEGMGNVVLEAMASKTPVVVTPYLGFPYSFGERDTHYLLSEFDDKSIAKNILQLASGEHSRQRIQNNALDNINHQHCVKNSLQQFANLYNH